MRMGERKALESIAESLDCQINSTIHTTTAFRYLVEALYGMAEDASGPEVRSFFEAANTALNMLAEGR